MKIKSNVHDYMTFYWTSKAVNSSIKNIGFYFDHLGFPQVVERGSIFGRYIERWDKSQDAQPAEQTSETCKWKRVNTPKNTIINPHNENYEIDTEVDCPTCGKRIEVVE